MLSVSFCHQCSYEYYDIVSYFFSHLSGLKKKKEKLTTPERKDFHKKNKINRRIFREQKKLPELDKK